MLDIGKQIKIEFFNEPDKSASMKNLNWIYQDDPNHGRCYTWIPNDKTVELGIKAIRLFFRASVKVFLHTPDAFYLSGKLYYELGLGALKNVDVSFEVHDILPKTDRFCEANRNYSYEQCVEDLIYKVSSVTIGAT